MKVIETLQQRHCKVYVLVGPFNEHMLKKESLLVYNKMLKEAESQLQEKDIMYHRFSIVPSNYYADASHPLAEGYKMLAERLYVSESFQAFDSNPSTR